MDSAHSWSVTSNSLLKPRASMSLVVLWGQYVFPLRGGEAPVDSVLQGVMVGSARPEGQVLCVWGLRQEACLLPTSSALYSFPQRPRLTL